MTDYWKSIPKKYCEFCKCWITDNKSSRDFHERGFHHQANVRKRVKDIQRNSKIQEKEKQQYNNEMLKIEAAALNSFQQDVARNLSLANEFANSKSLASNVSSSTDKYSSKPSNFNRFGESCDDESEKLISGKKRALETIAKSFEKKSKWLEAKTAENTTYYWNKQTLETRYDAPKSGYLSLEEQKQLKNIPSTSTEKISDNQCNLQKYDPYGGWRTVETNQSEKVVDLQLPGQELSQIILDINQQDEKNVSSENNKKEKFEFKEKTVESLQKKTSNKEENVSFKKRTSTKRNIRSRLQDD